MYTEFCESCIHYCIKCDNTTEKLVIGHDYLDKTDIYGCINYKKQCTATKRLVMGHDCSEYENKGDNNDNDK